MFATLTDILNPKFKPSVSGNVDILLTLPPISFEKTGLLQPCYNQELSADPILKGFR